MSTVFFVAAVGAVLLGRTLKKRKRITPASAEPEEQELEPESEKVQVPRLAIANPIYVSLTCNPINFHNLDAIFSSLDLDNVDKIQLNLVKGNKNDGGSIESLKDKFKEFLNVVYTEAHYGPIHGFINTLLAAP